MLKHCAQDVNRSRDTRYENAVPILKHDIRKIFQLCSTIIQLKDNPALGLNTTQSLRDATLPMPVLLLPSVQVNIRAGRLPEPEDNGVRYLKLPIDRL